MKIRILLALFLALTAQVIGAARFHAQHEQRKMDRAIASGNYGASSMAPVQLTGAELAISNRDGDLRVSGSMTLSSMLGSTNMGFGATHGSGGSSTTLHSTFTPPSMAAAAAMISATGVDPVQVPPQQNPLLMLHGFNVQGIELLTRSRSTHALPLVLLTPQAISAAAVVGGAIAAKIASDGTSKALDARDRQSGAAAAASGMPDPDSDDEGEQKKASELRDGMTISEEEALVEAEKFLGKNYTQAEKGRYVSQDGLRQIRMKDCDILGHHAGGKHMNFETFRPDPLRTGKSVLVDNKHIFLK